MIELIRKYYPHYEVSDPISEYPMWIIVDGYLMKWKFDVHAIYRSCTQCGMFYDRVAVEIDTPGKGHGTRITIPQDRFRDKFFMENDCIRTVRLNTHYVWGTKKMPDDVILAELRFLKQVSGGAAIYPIKFQIFEIFEMSGTMSETGGKHVFPLEKPVVIFEKHVVLGENHPVFKEKHG